MGDTSLDAEAVRELAPASLYSLDGGRSPW